MRTRSVGHACLEIETSGLRLLTDPWWAGPAYSHQWYPWPAPQPAGVETRPVDYVYLSHGHEDHFHPDTLRTLRPGATAIVPEFLTGSIGPTLQKELGFCQVIALRHGRTVVLRRGVRVTSYVNLAESILVIEDGDRVLVNANDALHASSPTMIDHFCRLIRRNHPSIDALFLGYSGASWFPNCVRVPGKQDRRVARAREELFRDNFIRVVDDLRPRVACAYAFSSVLVEPHLRWINEVKLEVPTPDLAYLRTRPASGTRVHLLLPNDVIDGIDVISGTTAHPSPTELEKAMQGSLRDAVDRVEHLRPLSSDELRDLVQKLDSRVRSNHRRLGGRPNFDVEIRLRDNPGVALHVELNRQGAHAALGVSRDSTVTLELRAEILDAVLRHDHGIEAIVIGSGAVATVDRPEHFCRIEALLSLLSARQGSWHAVAQELRRRPLRTVANLWDQRWPLALSIGTRIGMLSHPYELRNLGTGPAEVVRRAA